MVEKMEVQTGSAEYVRDLYHAYYATPEGAGYQQIVAGVMENQLTVDELKFLRGCWKTESVRRYGLIREDAHLLKKLNKMIDSLLSSARGEERTHPTGGKVQMSKTMICPKKDSCKHEYKISGQCKSAIPHNLSKLCSEWTFICPACIEVKEVSDAKQ